MSESVRVTAMQTTITSSSANLGPAAMVLLPTKVAAWLATQSPALAANLRRPADAAALYNYALDNADEVPTDVAGWTSKDIRAAIRYDPLSNAGDSAVTGLGVVTVPAAESVQSFKQLLADQGLAYFVTWRWEGWRKFGVIGVRPAGVENALEPALEREEFARSNSSFTAADRLIARVRTGSPKHLAILALTARLAERTGVPRG